MNLAVIRLSPRIAETTPYGIRAINCVGEEYDSESKKSNKLATLGLLESC